MLSGYARLFEELLVKTLDKIETPTETPREDAEGKEAPGHPGFREPV